MVSKHELATYVVQGLSEMGGQGTLLDVCKWVWDHKEQELRASGDLFYTWQYDIRWAATILRKEGIMLSDEQSPRGLWALKSKA